MRTFAVEWEVCAVDEGGPDHGQRRRVAGGTVECRAESEASLYLDVQRSLVERWPPVILADGYFSKITYKFSITEKEQVA